MPATNPRVNVVLEVPIYNQIHRMAKKEGISMADIYKSAARSYIDGNLSIGLIYYGTLTPNAKTGRELMKSRKEIKEWKNISGPFKTTAETNAFLDSLK